MTDPHAVRWFDHDKRIGMVPARIDDGTWILRLGHTEHCLEDSDLRTMLRAMRRMRDFRAGYRAARKMGEPTP